MNKLVLTIALGLMVSFAAQGAPVSYIFNNTTQSMVVFKGELSDADACGAARAARPDAKFIEVASQDADGHPVYVECE